MSRDTQVLRQTQTGLDSKTLTIPRWLQSPAWKNFRVQIGLAGLLLLVVIALFASVIAPSDPTEMHPSEALLGPGESGYLLGTDEYGRDMVSRLAYGARISLEISLTSVALGLVCGVVLGMLAGYFGGFIDSVIMRATDVLLCFPTILLAIAVLTFLGNSRTNLILTMGLLFTRGFVRIVYTSVQVVKHHEYVEASRGIGASNTRILVKAILPNVMSPIFVWASLALGSAIVLEAGLSFLGMGSVPPTPSWGIMLSSARNYMTHQPWMVVWPSIAVGFAILSANFLGDGLRDALDPRLRQ